MSYQVTARKWRPLIFEDVIGQTHVSNTLRNALATNRVAHAFIFTGTRGCGKTTTARILARAVNCLNPKDFNPCNECEVCKEILENRSMDVIEIDGASNRGVEEIRNLRESVRYVPTRAKKKVYIIDEVHMLTKEAFNALLKTLEEPPSHILFIFATTEIHKVPATILSRCQRYDFRRISVEEIVARLRFIAENEKITIDNDALLIIAKKGDGSMRDAQSIFDQVVSFCGTQISAQQVSTALNIVDQELFFRLSNAIHSHDTKEGLTIIDDVIRSGYDSKEFVSGLAEHFRNLLITKTTNTTQLIEESEIHKQQYAERAKEFSVQDILRLIKVATDLELSIRYAHQPRFKLEVAVVQMTKMESSVKIDELLSSLDELKKKSINEPITPQKSFSAEHYKVAEPKSTYTVQKKSVTETITENSVTISLTTVHEQWNSLLEEVRKKKSFVGTIMQETAPLDILHDTLRLQCKDEYHLSTIKRNKDFLTEILNTLLKSKLRLEPILGTQDSIIIEKKTIPTIPQEQPKQTQSPMLEKMIKDFGLEKV